MTTNKELNDEIERLLNFHRIFKIKSMSRGYLKDLLIEAVIKSRQEEHQRLIKEFKEMIEEHKDCKNYHRVDYPDKEEYLLCSCLMVILNKLNKLETCKRD